MPKKRWSPADERKYKSILKSCRSARGRKKGASKACKTIAAATVNRDRALAQIGMTTRTRGLGNCGCSAPANPNPVLAAPGMGGLAGDWRPGERRWNTGAKFKPSHDGSRIAFASDAEDTLSPPGDGEVFVTVFRRDPATPDDLEQVASAYYPDMATADRELVKHGISGRKRKRRR